MHPRYLDAKGFVAVWREGLLARAVLRGETRGYRHHPQLERFRRRADPVAASAGQVAHEWGHLLRKLWRRDRARWRRQRWAKPTCHPCFRVVPGGIERWERG